MKPSPVLFLDFDGVLNSLASSLAYRGKVDFCPTSLALVERLAVEADARVVVSSSWRIGASVEGLRGTLARHGAPRLAARIAGMTPELYTRRGFEIAAWLAGNPPPAGGRYCIVDDDADMLPEQMPHFVQTRHRDGFGVRDYVRALAILAPQHADVTQLDYYRNDNMLSSELTVQWLAGAAGALGPMA